MWYNRNEPSSLVSCAASVVILCLPSTVLLLSHVESFFIAFSLAFVTFLVILFGSISFYRLSPFHPLAKYPGPTRCKLTKIWMAWIGFRGRAHIYYKNLHDKYGPIVRIGESLLFKLCLLFLNLSIFSSGPNELSIINAELIPYILGSQGMPKGPSKINFIFQLYFCLRRFFCQCLTVDAY